MLNFILGLELFLFLCLFFYYKGFEIDIFNIKDTLLNILFTGIYCIYKLVLFNIVGGLFLSAIYLIVTGLQRG